MIEDFINAGGDMSSFVGSFLTCFPLPAGFDLRILFRDVEKWEIKKVENKRFLTNDEKWKR